MAGSSRSAARKEALVAADGGHRSGYRLKLLGFVLCTIAVLAATRVAYSALNTISRLDAVEVERDTWQRPDAVLQALDLKPGDTVVDLGCGSGYFSLKLSSSVGRTGRVLAEDIRREPLVSLWLRTLGTGHRNIGTIRGEPTDPHLPQGRVNGVLIANTYHEFTDSKAMLSHVWSSLVSGGRLVVVDRAPNPADVGKTEMGEHEISAEQVESELRQGKFAMVSREDHFIESDPQNESWWLVVAQKP
jgi:ubiquinone/menaquinone biosynthesis C-methylase UbiE